MKYALSVRRLAIDFDPFANDVWDVGVVSKRDVARALEREDLRAEPIDSYRYATTEEHAARIAYFVVCGWTDVIDIDLGVPALNFYPDWPIIDGNHRFAAAVYRGDEEILSECTGQIDCFDEYLLSESFAS